MKTIYLVRHGQASFGSQNYDQLSPNGQLQARLLGDYWKDKRTCLHRVFSGCHMRQTETAIIVSGVTSANIEQKPAFDEYPFHRLFELSQVKGGGKKHTDWRKVDKRDFRETLIRLFEQDIDFILEQQHLTTWRDFRHRCFQGVTDLLASNTQCSSIAIFTSAGVIGAIVQELLDINDAEAATKAFSLYNSAVTTLSYDGKKLLLNEFNQTEHLGLNVKSLLYSHL